MFSMCVILVTAVVVLEPVLGLLGMRQEYTLDGMLVHHRALHTLIHTSEETGESEGNSDMHRQNVGKSVSDAII